VNEKHDQGTTQAGAANSDPPAASSDSDTVTNVAGGTSEPATLEEALACIAELRATAAQREEEAAKLRDQYLRERAELENFKKRMQREKSEALRYATEPLLRELLPVIDNLERALQAAPPSSGQVPAEALRDGVAMVVQQFDEILQRFGVARLEASGQPFDPSEHEALAHVETTLQEPGCVLDEHLPGYRLHDRLLRAAQVTVAKAPSGEGK